MPNLLYPLVKIFGFIGADDPKQAAIATGIMMTGTAIGFVGMRSIGRMYDQFGNLSLSPRSKALGTAFNLGVNGNFSWGIYHQYKKPPQKGQED